MSTILVNSTAQLTSALQVANAGDVISLASGNYGDVLIKNKLFSGDVTITSQDATSPATLHTLTIYGSSHIHVDDVNVNFVPTATTLSFSTAVAITSSTSITLSDGSVTGGAAINGVDPSATALDSTGNVLGLPTGSGVSIQKSSGVIVDHMDISHLNSGLGMGASDHITITNNDIHDLRRTAIAGGGISDVTIDSNHLHDSNPWRWGQTPVGDHADFIAFWTDPSATVAANNIVVTNNLMEQGKGTAILGMWFEGQYGNLGFTNVTVENNAILNGNLQGITLKGVAGATVDHNTLLASSADVKTAPSVMLYANAQDVHITDNITSSIQDMSGTTGPDANVIGTNRIIQTSDATAGGYYNPSTLVPQVEAATVDVRFAVATAGVHGGLGDLLTALDGSGDVLTASVLAHQLVGGAGADTLNSGLGSDTLSGGGGADVFHIPYKTGHDVITDFGAGGHDVLDLSVMFSANMKPTLHDVGSDVNISFGANEVITLTGVHAANLIATSSGFTI